VGPGKGGSGCNKMWALLTYCYSLAALAGRGWPRSFFLPSLVCWIVLFGLADTVLVEHISWGGGNSTPTTGRGGGPGEGRAYALPSPGSAEWPQATPRLVVSTPCRSPCARYSGW